MTRSVQELLKDDLYPTTPAQSRFWFLDQVSPGSASSNIAVQWELQGDFRFSNLEAAFRTVLGRHEILRTKFIEIDGEVYQEVTGSTDFHLGVIDVRSLPRAERETRILHIAEELASDPFDLTQPTPLRATLVHFGTDCARLLIAVHHAVFDGFSIRVLGRELGEAVAALESGTDPDLPGLDLQFGDFALWQKACEDSEARGTAARYWRDKLSDMEYFQVSPDRTAVARATRNGARFSIALDKGFGERLAETARTLEASPFAVGASVAAATLHRYTGAQDISFGTTIAGRDEPELEPLIGVFVNPVVLRFAVAPEATLRSVVGQSRDVVAEALVHGDYPFDALTRDLRQARDATRTPIVSVFFGLQSVFVEERTYGPVKIVSVPSHSPEITHDLNILVIGRASGWNLIIDYDRDLFDTATIERLAEGLRAMFAWLADDPGAALCDVEVPPRQGHSLPAAAAVDPAPVPVVPKAEADAEITAALSAIWADVLGVPADRCDDDFFALGGHSLLSLRMLARVEQAFGARPGIAEFLTDPTLRGLAATVARLQNDEAPVPEDGAWSLIHLGDHTPADRLVVSINQPFLYNAMARKIGDAINVVNVHVNDPGILEDADARTLDGLVEDAARMVVQEAAGRPVTLIGHCIDGVLALRIGQTMEASGAGPELVAMIDSWKPRPAGNASALHRIFDRNRTRLRRWTSYIGQRLRGDIGWTEFLSKSRIGLRLLIRLGKAEPPTAAELQEWHINVLLTQQMQGAMFEPFSGQTILFSTASQPRDARARLFGWTGVLPPDTPVFDLPGWHEDALLRHGIDRIAEILQCRAQRAG